MINKRILNLAATLISVAMATPFAMHADKSGVMQGFDIEIETENYNEIYYNEADEFVTLDQEAIDELSLVGITVNDEISTISPEAQAIIDYAAKYLGRPYRSGAKGPSAFDCSGFTSYVFKNYGIALSPSSRAQATQGEKIALEQVRPGDLLFFGGRRGGSTVGHVALAVDVDDNGTITFIHASNSKGITYDRYPDGGYYSKRYIGARRVLQD